MTKDQTLEAWGLLAFNNYKQINRKKNYIKIVKKPTLLAFKNKKKFYNGFLYVGLMIKKVNHI